MTDPLSLNSMLQRELKNEVPDSVLRQCRSEADRILVENVLRVAQAERVVLNLASTTICIEGRKLTLKFCIDRTFVQVYRHTVLQGS
jgi:hypothetical protein